jgi:hypothetical protein
MSDEDINIAIAELVNGDNESPFHNYCNDLNAMHEAEKFLLSEYGMSYCTCLTYLIGKSVYASVHATARQRAEAFLRTLKKWESY